MQNRFLRYWHRLNEWWRALAVAIVLLVLVHVFILRFVTVRSTSMYATLLPGDLLGVTRWNAWTGLDRGDIAIFRDPLQDTRGMWRRELIVKRVVGMPGDTVRIRKGRLFVNGEALDFPGETRSHLLRMKKEKEAAALLEDIGLPGDLAPAGRQFVELPLNDSLRRAVRTRDEVMSVDAMSTATGAPRHIFPFSPYHPWNGDEYGPIVVPKAGDTLVLNDATMPLYDRLISEYEGARVERSGRSVIIDGVATDRYVVQWNYYFVLGDSRHFSADSRYWGFMPDDHLVGRAAFILLSTNRATVGPLKHRWLRGL